MTSELASILRRRQEGAARLWALAAPCLLCERRCGVDRLAGERGWCGAGPGLRTYQVFVHHGEEPEVAPCLAFFLPGCSFRCAFCSDGAAVDAPDAGQPLDAADVVAVAAHRAGTFRSIEFVGGCPSVRLPWVGQAVVALPPDVPVVLALNGFLPPEALEAASLLADALLVDLKFGNDSCAASLAGVEGYLGVLHRNLSSLSSLAGDLRPHLIVRHLLLPGHVRCCAMPAMDWAACNLPEGVVFNLMTGYQPLHRAREVGVGGRPTPAETERLLASREAAALGARLRVNGRLP